MDVGLGWELAAKDAKRQVARVRELHQEYLPAHVDFYTCAHCNMLHGGNAVEPWPCPTIRALDGKDPSPNGIVFTR
jgi:rubrerythrin